jgi:hypothetical protein
LEFGLQAVKFSIEMPVPKAILKPPVG